MTDSQHATRRLFLIGSAAASAGLVIGIALPGGPCHAQSNPVEKPEINAWVLIRPDETVVVRVARSEVGQGTVTALAQLVAEELGCDWSRVVTELALPGRSLGRNRVWRDFSTTNSRGVRASQDYMRQAGAAARQLLLEAAAGQWNVTVAELETDQGEVFHRPTGRSTSYGRLAPVAARLVAPDAAVMKLKSLAEWTIAGKPLRRADRTDRLNGRAIYGIDVKLPGMLCAAIRDAPVFGAKLSAFEASAVKDGPGVRRVLAVGDSAVAVVADTWWQAQKALRALPVAWTETTDAAADSDTIAEYLKAGLDIKSAFIGHSHGDALKAMAGAAKRIEAVYGLPFAHQAPLEPMNCTALWTSERVEVWVPTQNAEASLSAAAEAAGLRVDQAEVHRTEVGGSFGRRGRQDYVTQAVRIAREMPGTPVKLIWSREEDFSNGYYRPIGQCKLVGGLDEKGELTGLIVRISGQSVLASLNSRAEQTGKDNRVFQGLYAEAGEAQFGYSIPNLYIDHAMRSTHVPVGSWRGVYTNHNALYLECFIDELARAAGKDPLDFRRHMMKSHLKHLAVLGAVAERTSWGETLPEGMHRGIAQMMAFGSYTAAVAEVSVSQDGRPRVHRVVLAIDCGTVVNPDLIAAQVEGATAMSLSSLLGEEITIRDGRAVEQNFDTYRILRLAEMPRVETVLVPSGDFWGGVGDATIGVVAPAVLNAIYAATGQRVRSLPLKTLPPR